MFVNPTKEFKFVYLFNIDKTIDDRGSEYEATRKYWIVSETFRYNPGAVAVGLVDGESVAVYKIKNWYESKEVPGKYEFNKENISQTDIIIKTFLHKNFKNVIEAAKGYWQYGNWIAVHFYGDGTFSILKGSKTNKKLPCDNKFPVEEYIIPQEEITKIDVSFPDISGEEKYAVVKQRVNQSIIRKHALSKYKSKCLLCGISKSELLIASHIKSWADSSPAEKGNLNNILLLCPNHDSLFDKHLISIAEDGKLLISNKLGETDRIFLNVNEQMSLTIPINDEMKTFLNFHRNRFFNKNNNTDLDD